MDIEEKQNRRLKGILNVEVFEMSIVRPERDEDWLRKKYLKEGLSLRDIAELAGVSYETVRSWLLKYNIPLRKKNDYRKRTMTIEEAQAILAEPEPEFITQEEYEKQRAELHGRKRREHLRELAAQLKREKLDREAEVIESWHRGDVEEEMSDIQRLADTVEDKNEKKPVKATPKEKAYIERS